MKVTECTARTLRQGEAISELEAQGEDLEVAMAKAERALSDIGITIRGETADELRGIEEIIGDVADAWDTLSDSERQAVSEAMAGTQRSSMFSALIENYDKVRILQEEGLNSSGELFEANQRRVESLEGQINILNDKLLAFMDGFQPIIYGSVQFGNAVLDVVDKIGTIPSAIGVATSAFLTFNQSGKAMRDTLIDLSGNYAPFIKKITELRSEQLASIDVSKLNIASIKSDISARKLQNQSVSDLVVKLKTEQASLKATQIQLAATTAGTIALQTVMSLGLGLAIGGVISLASKLVSALSNASSSVDNLNESFSNMKNDYDSMSSNVSNLTTLVGKYEELQSKMKSSKAGTDEYKKSEEELLNIQKQLAENYPNLVSYIDEEGNAYATNLDAIKTYTEAQKELLATQKEAMESTAKANKPKLEVELQNLKSDRDDYQDRINSYAQQIAELEKKMVDSNNPIFKALAQADIAQMTNEQNRLIEKLVETNNKISDTSNTLTGYEQILKETNDTTKETISSTDNLANSLSNLEDSDKGMKELNESYLETAENMKEAQELLNSLSDGLDVSELRSIFDSDLMADFNGSLNDTVAITDHLKNKIREMEDSMYTTCANMALANDDTWNQMTAKMAESLNVDVGLFQDFVDSVGGLRQVDLQNCTNSLEAQNMMEAQLAADAMKYYAQMINSKASNRQTDMQNVAEFLNTQGAKEAKTVQELADMWAQFYSAKADAINAEIRELNTKIGQMNNLGLNADTLEGFEDMIMGTNGVSKTAKNQAAKLQSQLKSLNTLNTSFTNYFNGIQDTFSGVSKGLSQNMANTQKLANSIKNQSTGSKGNSGSKGSSSSTEKEVEDLELEIDRYYKLKDAIKDLNNSLSMLQAKREQITTKDAYKKSMEEEIALINKQIIAQQNLLKEQQKERNEIKSALNKNGFKFDSEGDITNYATQLKKLQDAANRKSGEAKEVAIAQVEALADLIEKYNELNDSSIPNTTLEIQNLKNEITNLNKELEENMKAIEKMGDRYFYITSKIAQVDNAIAMNQALQETASEERKIELMKEQIALIKQRQELTKSEKVEAQQEANELKQQLAKKGVTFNSNGQIGNYEVLINSLQNKANNLVGDAQDEAIEDIKKLLDLIEKYTTLNDETIPELSLAWQEYTNEMQSVQDAIDNIYKQQKETAVQTQKDIASAYEKYLTDRYNKLKEALNKEQEAYNKAYDEDNFQRDLSNQQRVLDEIAQQIAIYERDTSAVGQARLEQLRKEYEEQQQSINDMIREQEKSKTDQAFSEASKSLDEELENALSPENVANIVNQALASGFVTIGDSVVELNGLMTQWIDDTGDGLYLLGDTIKTEMIDNLQQARDLIKEFDTFSSWSRMINLTSDNVTNVGKSIPRSISFEFNQPLVNIEGNADNSMVNNIGEIVKSQLESMEKRIYSEMMKALT